MTYNHSFVSDIWFTNTSTNIRIIQWLFGTSCNSLSVLIKSILNTNCWNNFRAISIGIFIAQIAYYTSGMLWIPIYCIYSQIYYHLFSLWNYLSTLFSRSRYIAVLFVLSVPFSWFIIPCRHQNAICTWWRHQIIFRVTDHLCGEFTGQRWIPRTKASDAVLWCFFDVRLNKRLSKQS